MSIMSKIFIMVMKIQVHLIGRYASLLLKAPCLLPELASVESVAVHSDNFYKAELVFQPSLDDLREPFKLGYQHVTAVNRSAGQPIVLYVKKSRVGNNEQPFDYMLQNTPSPSIVSYRLFNIKDQQMRGRHLNHIAKLQDLLSLKSKSVANTLNGLPTDHSHSCLKSTSQHANHNDVSNIYSTVEEILLSGNERSKGTVAILRCLAECDFLFRDLSNVFLPTRQEPAVSDDLKCTGKVPEGVLDQYQKSDESSVYCSNTLAYPSFGNKRNLAALFFSASHPSVN